MDAVGAEKEPLCRAFAGALADYHAEGRYGFTAPGLRQGPRC